MARVSHAQDQPPLRHPPDDRSQPPHQRAKNSAATRSSPPAFPGIADWGMTEGIPRCASVGLKQKASDLPVASSLPQKRPLLKLGTGSATDAGRVSIHLMPTHTEERAELICRRVRRYPSTVLH